MRDIYGLKPGANTVRLKPVEFRRRSVWHAHTGYANLSGQLLNLSATLPQDVAALATVEPAGAAINALVAHAGHTSTGGKTLAVTLVLRNCGAVSSVARPARVAWLAHIVSDVSRNCSVRQTQHQPPDFSCAITDPTRSTPAYSRMMPVAEVNSISIELPLLHPQDVVSVRIEPGC